jgi:hypothetical protein
VDVDMEEAGKAEEAAEVAGTGGDSNQDGARAGGMGDMGDTGDMDGGEDEGGATLSAKGSKKKTTKTRAKKQSKAGRGGSDAADVLACSNCRKVFKSEAGFEYHMDKMPCKKWMAERKKSGNVSRKQQQFIATQAAASLSQPGRLRRQFSGDDAEANPRRPPSLPDWQCSAGNVQIMDDATAASYLASLTYMPGTVGVAGGGGGEGSGGSGVGGGVFSAKTATREKNTPVFAVGGAVTAMDWCPGSPPNDAANGAQGVNGVGELIALSATRQGGNGGPVLGAVSDGTGKNVIQFWRVRCKTGGGEAGGVGAVAGTRLEMALAVNAHRIFALQWCPLGGPHSRASSESGAGGAGGSSGGGASTSPFPPASPASGSRTPTPARSRAGSFGSSSAFSPAREGGGSGSNGSGSSSRRFARAGLLSCVSDDGKVYVWAIPSMEDVGKMRKGNVEEMR